MNARCSDITRRQILVRGSRLGLILGAAGTAGVALRVEAAKATKADFSYRDKPKGGSSCSSCRLFSPLDPVKGVCAVVEGEVSADGWCMAYSPK